MSVEAIQEIVGRQLGLRGVKADDELTADLGVESIDILNLVRVLEEKYRVAVTDAELERLKTVRDFHTVIASKL